MACHINQPNVVNYSNSANVSIMSSVTGVSEMALLTPDDPELSYQRRTDDNKKSIAWGQLKLMISEIWFLTNYYQKSNVQNPIVVYAGAADGRHIRYLSEFFFPEIEFHLYDSRPFRVKASDKIHLYHRYFEDTDTLRWSAHQREHGNIFLISDIRTADYRIMNNAQNERAVDEDNRKQERWYRAIKPVAALLKFRPHYAYPFLPKSYRYLKGTLFKQPWAPQTSTETRLVPITGGNIGKNNETDDVGDIIDYDVEKYGNQMFYHNTILRETKKFLNPLDGSESPIAAPELMNDFDSVVHISVLREYLYVRTGSVPDPKDVIALSQSLIDMLTEHLSPEHKFTLSALRQGISHPGNSKPIRSVSQLTVLRRMKHHQSGAGPETGGDIDEDE